MLNFTLIDCRYALMNTTVNRQETDGLNSLVYNLTSVEKLPLYTLISVETISDQEIHEIWSQTTTTSESEEISDNLDQITTTTEQDIYNSHDQTTTNILSDLI